MRFTHFHSTGSSVPSIPVSPVPDKLSASTFNFDYRLVDGLIYLRTNTPNDPKEMVRGDLVSTKDKQDALQWKLLDGKGVPFNSSMKSLLARGERLIEIAVASEIVVAVSNLQRVYLYKPTEYTRPLSWSGLLGSPDILSRDNLYLPEERRDWAFSCSVRKKPETRRTDFIDPREIVSHFSDANGVKFDFGFTPTIYVLDRDGLTIVYWDTGLPASFSRGFLVPDGVQGQSISAAGSTVFLSAIDAQGKLHFYTRMIDYEINGACPGLKVDYTDIPLVYPPEGAEGSFYLGFGVRKMPLKGWVEHSIDGLPYGLTHRVCIRLTGQGDDARELRIQGLHPEKGWGYYVKNITDAAWDFCPAPVIPAEPVAHPYNSIFPESQKLNYDCTRTLGSDSDITMELKGFHPFLTDAEPCYLVLSREGESSQSLRVHAVDAWGLHYHQKHDEVLVGKVDGEPKALMGTLVLTPEQIEFAKTSQSKLGSYLRNNFLSYHGQTKALRLIADNRKVILRLNMLDDWIFIRKVTQAEIDTSFYMRQVMSPELTATPVDKKEAEKLLAKNRARLKAIESIYYSRRKADSKHAIVNFDIGALRHLASGFFDVHPKADDPTYKQAVEDIKLPLRAQREATTASMLGEGRALGYIKARALLHSRIKTLQEFKQKPHEPTPTNALS